MQNEWDRDTNILTEEEKRAEWERQWQAERAERARRREISGRRDYVIPPGMPENEVNDLFPHHRERYTDEERRQYAFRDDIYMPYWANKLYFVCHNCGHIGWKHARCHQLYKCYCGSRNGVLIRASHISKILRDHPEYTTHMEDVFNERQDRNRRERAERSARRRNS